MSYISSEKNINISIDKLVHELKKYPLDNKDMLKFEPTKIHSYDKIENNIYNVDELFDRKNRCIIFYPTNSSANLGHWTCLIKNGDTVEWFEPYAINPITEMNNILEGELQLDPKYLIDKIIEDGYLFEQNKIKYQDIKDNENNTCGRFVILRLTLNNFNNEQFNEFIKSFKKKYSLDPLELSIIYTSEKINK